MRFPIQLRVRVLQDGCGLRGDAVGTAHEWAFGARGDSAVLDDQRQIRRKEGGLGRVGEERTAEPEDVRVSVPHRTIITLRDESAQILVPRVWAAQLLPVLGCR
jgi:hypothetical protein